MVTGRGEIALNAALEMRQSPADWPVDVTVSPAATHPVLSRLTLRAATRGRSAATCREEWCGDGGNFTQRPNARRLGRAQRRWVLDCRICQRDRDASRNGHAWHHRGGARDQTQ